MSEPKPGLFDELKRRHVFRVAAMYAVVGWLLIQIGEATFEALGLPDGSLRLLIIAVAVGFPVALVVGWLFDWTSEGVVRTTDDPEQAAARHQNHRRIDFVIIGALVLALGMALFGPEIETPYTETPPIRTIAVMSFSDMSPASDQGYLGDGIAEEIMAGLSKVEELRVTARTSAFAFKGKNENIKSIGEQLGVGAVVDGSVRKAGDRLRIKAQLVRVDDGFELWSNSFDRNLDDVFAIQEQIARATVSALRVQLIGAEPLVDPPTKDVRAYESYVTGRHFLARRTKENLVEAVAYFERALAIDANFELAYVGLADTHLLAFVYAYGEDIGSLVEAEAAAHRALAIEPNSGEARTSLAYIRMLQTRMKESDAGFREAIRLAPAYAGARLFYSLLLRTAGRPDEARREMNTALELDPLSPIINREVGRAAFYEGDYDRALEFLGRTLKLYPDMPLARMYLGRANLAVGREIELFGWFPGQDEAELRSAYEEGGFRAMLKRSLDMEITKTSRPCTRRPDLAALTFALLKDPDRMYACLDKALERRGPMAIVIAPDEAFADYRSEPRFLGVLDQLGLRH